MSAVLGSTTHTLSSASAHFMMMQRRLKLDIIAGWNAAC